MKAEDLPRVELWSEKRSLRGIGSSWEPFLVSISVILQGLSFHVGYSGNSLLLIGKSG